MKLLSLFHRNETSFKQTRLNKMYIEITEALFKSIVTKETKCINAIQLDHAFKTMFFVHGVLLMKVESYLSCVTQYYIQDINA